MNEHLAEVEATAHGPAAGPADTAAGPAVPLEAFLAGVRAAPPAERIKLLWQDQRRRWGRGGGPLVEDYQRGLSPGPSPEELLDLLYGEYVLRREAGEAVAPEELCRRFPALAEQIRRQVALHDGLSAADATDPAETTSGEPAGDRPDEIAPATVTESVLRSRPAAGPASSPGELAGYQVVALLDSGAQGSVYRGVHPTLRRDVVIKLGRPCDPSSREAELLVREGRILAELDDPGLARVFDLKFHEGRPCLVMEFIRGRHLEQDSRQRRRDPRAAALLVARLARAVAVVHRKGVIHRDVKPRNILIDEAGQPRLIDFGLALLEDAWRPAEAEAGVCGTLAYMAPEQARGEPATARSDLFALGGVLFFLLTGAAPFDGSTFEEVHRKARHCEWDRRKLVERGVPPRLRAVVEKAMAADPAARYASAEEMADALEAAVRPAPAWRLWAAAVGAAAAVLLGVLAWRGLAPTPEPVPLPPPSGGDVAVPKTAEPRPFALQARVWRGRRYVDLLNAVPLAAGDKLRLEAVAPAALHSALFAVNRAGEVKLLATRPPAGKDGPITYPESAKESVALTGPVGNEFILLCARRSGPVAVEELREALEKVAYWPTVPPDSVLGLSPQFAKVLQPGRDLGARAAQDDPEGEVRQRLEELRPRLAARFEYFEGLVFSHGE